MTLDDTYVVQTESTAKKIWQENRIKPMGEEVFDTLYGEVMAYLQSQPELFSTHGGLGLPGQGSLNIEFRSESPSATLLAKSLFDQKDAVVRETYKVLHAPFFEASPFKYGTRSDTVIATSFDKKQVVIVGSQSADEIKSSLFAVRNYLTIEQGALPIRASVRKNSQGEQSLIFGESNSELLNFSADGPIPKHIFFLSADATGVLPPISQLSLREAADYFLLGYAATEDLFTPCYGAPYMLRHPLEYAKIFANFVEKYHIQVWLVNTGPAQTWPSAGEYENAATALRAAFELQLGKFRYDS